MRFVGMISGLIGGLAIGLWLADIDHVFPFLVHRSMITHGVVLPALAYGAYRATQRDEIWIRMMIVGLCLGMSIHTAFDLFPASWHGYALIHAPLLGRFSTTFSILWIGINIIACFYLTTYLLTSRGEVIAAAILLAIGFLVYGTGQRNDFAALFVMGALLAVAMYIPPRLAVRLVRSP